MNKALQLLWIPICLTAIGLSGCAVGYDTMVFTTKSNAGLDFDLKPPTSELSIARREVVVGPSFERGKKPPVIASFRSGTNSFTTFVFGGSATFAGGDAAYVMSRLWDQQEPDTDPFYNGLDSYDSILCLRERPMYYHPVYGSVQAIRGPEGVQPFIFGTDSTFGVKVGWSGMTAYWPDTVKTGFHRKELAIAPVFWVDNQTESSPVEESENEDKSRAISGRDKCNGGPFKGGVKVASFLASLGLKQEIGESPGQSVDLQQFFATGNAATNLAFKRDIRAIMRGQLSYQAAASSRVLAEWSEKGNNDRKLKDWIEANEVRRNGRLITAKTLIYGEIYHTERLRVMKAMGVKRNPFGRSEDEIPLGAES